MRLGSTAEDVSFSGPSAGGGDSASVTTAAGTSLTALVLIAGAASSAASTGRLRLKGACSAGTTFSGGLAARSSATRAAQSNRRLPTVLRPNPALRPMVSHTSFTDAQR